VRTRSRIAPALALALASAVSLPGAQQLQRPGLPPISVLPEPQAPPVTFRSEVSFVEVDAIVRDRNGRLVTDLGQDDFQVLEDGVPQKVTAFSVVDIPIVAPDRPLFLGRDIVPDVRSNADGPTGRIYVLLLDDLHTAFSRTAQVKRLATEFIERNVGSGDMVSVLFTSGRTDGTQDFTSSRPLLLRAVDRFAGRKLRSAFLDKLDIYNSNRASGTNAETVRDTEEPERLQQAQGVLATLKNVSDWLAGIRGRRKAVVLVSEGLDHNPFGADSYAESSAAAASQSSSSSADTSGSSSSSSGPQSYVSGNRGDGMALLRDSEDAVAAAARANVNIYAIDPRGLAVGDEDMITVSGSAPDDHSLGLNSTELTAELRRGQDSLRELADQTGGFAAVGSNDFESAFARIAQENGTYYLLGYYPQNERRDGRFRRLQVKVTRPGAYEVKSRKGYALPSTKSGRTPGATGAGTPAGGRELREALDNPIEVADFRFAVFAAALRGGRRNGIVALTLQFDGRDIAFGQAGAQRTNLLDLSYAAVDATGRVAGGNTERITLAVKPDTYQRIMQSGFRVQSRLELPPGRYQLRVAARESGGRVGTVHYDLEVPDFAKHAFGMSGLVMASRAGGEVPTAGSVTELAGALPGAPTTARTFRAGDELSVLAEIYDNYTRRLHEVAVTTTLRSDSGSAIYANTESRTGEEIRDGAGGGRCVARIPLTGVAPGLYLLRVEAKADVRGAATIARDVQIRIIP
jgi:VWFA-related protein